MYLVNNLSFILFYLLFTAVTHAQKIQIISSYNSEPIIFAKVICQDIDNYVWNGDYTNEQGFVTIQDTVPYQYLKIEVFNYKTVTIKKSEIQNVIRLEDDVEELENITIEANAPQSHILNKKVPEKNDIYMSASAGFQIVDLIKNHLEKEVYLKNFHFFIRKRKLKESGFIRVIVYENLNGIPGKLLYKTEAIELKYKSKNEMIVNLMDSNLSLPTHGLFIGVEYLGLSSKDDRFNDISIAYSIKQKPLPLHLIMIFLV